MVLTVAPLSYRSVQIVDPITGNAAFVVGNALQTTASGGGGGSVTQGTVPWVVSGGGTAGTAATGVVTVQGIASGTVVPTNVAQINGVTTTMGNGVSGTGVQRVTIASDSTGQIALAAGAQSQPVPGTSGGYLISSTIIPNNTTAIVVKGSAGQLYGIRAYSVGAVSTVAIIKIYNATSATAGSGTPVERHPIPAPGTGGGIIPSDAIGGAYSTGITYVITTGIADNDTTAPAASSYIVNMYYK